MNPGIDKIMAFLAALAAPALTGMVDERWLSATQATDIGAMIATAITFLHVNNDSARRALAEVRRSQPAALQPSPVVSAFGDTL